ncbi:MAG: histidine kinase, partial [Ramlibacter sp.]|nr:histidine kinase [Ramlibacter sp.]
MMYTFLANNRSELIERCRAKVAQRPHRAAAVNQLATGVPIFLEQLERTLEAEEHGQNGLSEDISGKSGGDTGVLSEIGLSAMSHGRLLLDLEYTIDQVVHDYGDLCQAITDLAVEKDAPFGVQEFRTLNRCLDNAIADAATGFSLQRDAARDASANQRVGFLVHELRNALGTAVLAVEALEHGSLPISGATGSVLKRSHAALQRLIDLALNDVRHTSPFSPRSVFAVAGFIDDSVIAAALYAKATGCTLVATAVAPLIMVQGNRDLLFAALANVLQNAFKFTRPGSEIRLSVNVVDGQVRIDVQDECGGLPGGNVDGIFVPFAQHNHDRTGLGLGLSIARHSVEADAGTLTAS